MAQGDHDPRAREPRIAGGLAGLGLAALALSSAFEAVAGSGGPPLCPFRLATGLPCPFCGGTRALAATARGDLDGALRLGAAWPVVAALLVAAGIAGATAARRGRAPRTAVVHGLRANAARRPRVGLAAVLVALAVPWAVALANRDAITTEGTARGQSRPGPAWPPPRATLRVGATCSWTEAVGAGRAESRAPAPPSAARADIGSVRGRLVPSAPS